MPGSIKLKCTQEQADRWYSHLELAEKCRHAQFQKFSHQEIQEQAKKAQELYKTQSKNATRKALGISHTTLDTFLNMEVA